MTDQTKPADACPVDHKSREAWLAHAHTASERALQAPGQPPPSTQQSRTTMYNAQEEGETCPVDHEATRATPTAWTPSFLRSWWASSSTPTASTTTPAVQQKQLQQLPLRSSATGPLDTAREVSTIPRANAPCHSTSSSSSEEAEQQQQQAGSCRPANQERETGVDATTGNWVYPSQKMFFEAMKRKGHDPRAQDMQTVVSIHNAVNERAWQEIKDWECPWLKASTCDGPRLHSFSGLSTQMSPRARIKTMLGYTAPFDRHDWVVDRCGKEVEYIIDFYAGRDTGPGKLSFYLDVRPKLNSWEGLKMRVSRAVGLV